MNYFIKFIIINICIKKKMQNHLFLANELKIIHFCYEQGSKLKCTKKLKTFEIDQGNVKLGEAIIRINNILFSLKKNLLNNLCYFMNSQDMSNHFKPFNCLSFFYINLMNKNQNNKNQQTVPWTALFKENKEKFAEKINYLGRLIKIWHQLQKKPYQTQFYDDNILIQYAFYIEEFYNNLGLQEHFELNSLKHDYQLRQVNSQKQIYLRYDLIDSKNWKINFNYQFILHLSEQSYQIIEHIFVLMFMYAQGYLPFHGPSQIALKQVDYYNSQRKYYTVPINKQYCLLISIGVLKIPIFTYKTHTLKQFQFQSFIQCQEIFPLLDIQNGFIKNTIKNRQNCYQSNPKFSFEKDQLIILSGKDKSTSNYYGNEKQREIRNSIFKIYPYIYKSQLADQFSCQNYEFLIKKWKFYHNKNIYLSNFQKNTKPISENIYPSYSIQSRKDAQSRQQMEFTNTSKILEVLQLTPSFKYRLTDQQRQVLSKSGSLIVIGRSGTGKTTCALYRLYGIQFILKKRQINRIFSSDSQNKKCKMMLFEELHFSKNIFLTFSPFLIKQIQDQYIDILLQLKQKHAQQSKCLQCKNKFPKKGKQAKENDPIDRLYSLQKRQKQKIKSLNFLAKQEYPAFFTIDHFIKVIDQTVERSFYHHQLEKTNKNIPNAINRSYINHYEYTAQRIKKEQPVKSIQVNFAFFQRHIWPHLPKQLLKTQKNCSLLTPAIVWAEIFSIIKGSIKSFTFPEGYISREMYLKQKRNAFQNLQQTEVNEIKNKVYTIFTIYQGRCKNEKYYDLMDVVNHLLRQIELFGYSGPKMNYVFIDEVQDLTTATIFLLSKLVLNNIFYCGDTAQAITKGVDFRFQDIKYIFNKNCFTNALQLSPPSDPISLTVNFRSHNRILQLANSIISTIQEIFPKAIKRMKIKQKSDLFGPPPFIIPNRMDLLLNLLNLIIIQKMNKKTVNSNIQQIIVVRNQEQKQKLPQILKQINKFTPEEIKGLEYDQVILFNYFSSCPCIEKWKILDYLFIEQSFEDQKEFEEKLSRRRKQEAGVDQKLNDDLRHLLEYDFDFRRYKIRTIKIKQSINKINLNYYYELITELKMLYTIITRSRIALVIYDNHIPKNLIQLWEKMNLITFIDDQNVIINQKGIKTYTQKQRDEKQLNQIQMWEKEGIDMLSRKLYENAKNCFRKINRQDIIHRIEAMQLVVKAQNDLFELSIDQKKKIFGGKLEKMIKNVKFNRKKVSILEKFIQAARIFQKYSRWEEAANAYEKGEHLMKALQCYFILNDVYKIAQCYFTLKQYANALEFYQRIGSIQKIIQCCILGEMWVQLFRELDQNQLVKVKIKTINSNIIRLCIYHMLHNTIQNSKIKKYHNHFKQQKSITNKNVQWNKTKYITSDLLDQIQRINAKYNCLHTKTLLQIFVIYQQIRINYQQQSLKLKQILTEKAMIQKEHENIQNKIKDIRIDNKKLSELLKQTKNKLNYISLDIQPKSLSFSVSQLSSIFLIQYLINSFSQQKDKLQVKQAKLQNQLQLNLENNQNLKYPYQKNKLQLNNIRKQQQQSLQKLKLIQEKNRNFYYQYTLNQLNKLSLKIRQTLENQINKDSQNQMMNNKYRPINSNILQCQSNLKLNLNLLKSKQLTMLNNKLSSTNLTFSISTLQENTNDDIFGMNLLMIEKKQIINSISKIISKSQMFFKFQRDSLYDNSHHRYIEQKVIKKFQQQQQSEQLSQILNLYNKCDIIGASMCNLLICAHLKGLIYLSLKHILGYTLEFSQVYKYNRFVKNKKIDLNFKDNFNLQQLHNFLINIDNNVLTHKIPRVGLANTFYYRSIINDLVTGLILQGHLKQALIFCDSSICCQMAYLCSDYELMINQIKKISNQNNIVYPELKSNFRYLFINEEKFLQRIPEAQIINVFSTQQIFYEYDSCQQFPFLTQKIAANNIEIQQQTVDNIMNNLVRSRIQELKRQQKIPKELLIDEQKLQEQICQQLIQKQRQQKCKKQRIQQIDNPINKILEKTNIAKVNLFLKYYFQGSLCFNNKKSKLSTKQIQQQYANILEDGSNLYEIQQQKYNSLKICNVIIFYLSYIFNQIFRQNIQCLINKNYQKFLSLNKSIQYTTNSITQLNLKIQKNYLSQKQRKEICYQKKISNQKLNQLKAQISKNPVELLQIFLENVTQKIKNCKKEDKFIEILFGFFQCRIIKNCFPIDFLSSQYVFVRSNSKIMEQLKIQHTRFCYYFDNQNKFALCKFIDVEKIIVNIINKQHKSIKISQIKSNKLPINFNRSIKNNQQLNNYIFLCKNLEEKRNINYVFSQKYMKLTMKQKINKIKMSLLQFYFENSYENKESFHFVQHQLNEYQFLEQMQLKMHFNPIQLLQMQKKFINLERQFKKWSSMAKKNES